MGGTGLRERGAAWPGSWVGPGVLLERKQEREPEPEGELEPEPELELELEGELEPELGEGEERRTLGAPVPLHTGCLWKSSDF